jgi:hypothetical protein
MHRTISPLLIVSCLAAPALAEETGLGNAEGEVTADLYSTQVVPGQGGELDVEAVRAGVEAELPAIGTCYAAKWDRQAEDTQAGEVLVFLSFDAKGKIGTVQAGGLNDAATACVTRAVKKAKLAPKVRGVMTARIYLSKRAGGLTGGFSAKGSGGLAELDVGDGKVAAGIDRAIVRRYVMRQRARLSYCHEKHAAAATRALRGTLSFDIDADGKLSAVVSSGDAPAEVHTCVQDAMRTVVLPKPKDGTPVKASFPLVFTPAKKP